MNLDISDDIALPLSRGYDSWVVWASPHRPTCRPGRCSVGGRFHHKPLRTALPGFFASFSQGDLQKKQFVFQANDGSCDLIILAGPPVFIWSNFLFLVNAVRALLISFRRCLWSRTPPWSGISLFFSNSSKYLTRVGRPFFLTVTVTFPGRYQSFHLRHISNPQLPPWWENNRRANKCRQQETKKTGASI